MPKDQTVQTTMIDAVQMNLDHPATFRIPSRDARYSLTVGDWAKIGLMSEVGAERFWLKVTKVRGAGAASRYVGTVDNNLVVYDIPLGEVMEFDPTHILEISRKPVLN
jgi:hypothetical protein